MISNNYINEWKDALSRTKRFGLGFPAHELQLSSCYLTDARQLEFPHIVYREVGELGPEEIVGQCMAIHYRLIPVMESWLGCPVIYTIGWVDLGDSNLFKFDEKFIGDKLKNGHTESTINLHAWLTLPSMEIIDMALATTIAEVKGLPEGRGRMLARHADGLDGMAYKPMLAGADFLKKIGILIDFQYFN